VAEMGKLVAFGLLINLDKHFIYR